MSLKAKVRIKEFDPGVLERLKKSTKETRVVVGLPKDAAPYPDGTPVQGVGATHEFGAEGIFTFTGRSGDRVTVNGIPERSFLRSTLDQNEDQYLKMLEKGILNFVEKGTPLRHALGSVGLQATGDVQQMITDIQEPPNSPQVVKAKGSSNPLIDTGHMRQSVNFEVREAKDV